MLHNYIKIAWRNLIKSKVFSGINVFGLALGLATCLLILLYMADEWKIDKHHHAPERLFRVALATPNDRWSSLPGPVSAALQEDFPEIETSTRILKFPGFENVLLKYDQGKAMKEFFEPNAYYADSTLFDVLAYDFKYGSPVKALSRPNTVVLSEKVAGKLFGDDNPVGKVIKVGLTFGSSDYTVSGVYRTTQQSHINAHLLLSMQNSGIGGWVTQQKSWANNNLFHTYIRLRPGTDAGIFEAKLPPFLGRRGGDDLKAMGIPKRLFLQSVPDIYLKSNIGNELSPNGSITYLYIFGSIGLFILFIACINFMNLSTARSEKRAKEVGVRKAMGALRSALVYQFLAESLIMSVLALVFSTLLMILLLPTLNNLTGKELRLLGDPRFFFWMVGIAITTGLLAGLYPALYLSSFRPISVLKGKLTNSVTATAVRKGLVVFQFTISMVLILGAVISWQQLAFVQKQNLGFDKDQKVVVPLKSTRTLSNYRVFRDELLLHAQVKSVTSGSVHPGIETVEDLLFYKDNQTMHEAVDIHLATVETDYAETLGITLLEGRTFTKDFPGDSSSIVLNEAAIKKLGFSPRDAIGKRLYYEFNGTKKQLEIIGVLKDFNFQSLHNQIQPYGLTSFITEKHQYLIASVHTHDYAGLLRDMKTIWEKLGPDTPFTYSFLDQDFQKRYEKDQRTADIIACFTAIAIVIACLGLFGLATFSATQRKKEIGVRKVLGASVVSIAGMLSKDFLVLVLTAILIASPLGWYVMSRWLQGFAYKVEIQWWIFALSGLLSLLVAILTVLSQSIRAALINPVKSLRSE